MTCTEEATKMSAKYMQKCKKAGHAQKPEA